MGTLFVSGNDATPALLNQYYGNADTTTIAVTSASLANLSTVYTIPALEPSVASSYELVCGGSGQWGGTQQNLSFFPAIGGTNLTSAGVTIDKTVFAASANFRWSARFVIVFATVGGSGSVFGSILGTLSQNANNIIPGTAANNTVAFADADSASVTVNTTTTTNVVLKCQWGSTTGAPTITCRHTIFRKIA